MKRIDTVGIQTLKQYYKKYSKTLMSTIAASKKRFFDSLISESNNKIKTVWNIVKTVTN